MRVGEACNKTAIVADSDTGIAEATRLMREQDVGTLVIVARSSGTLPAELIGCRPRRVRHKQEIEATARP